MDEDMKSLSRKEAAKVLEDMKVKIEIPKAAVTQWIRNTALDMAIEALKYSGIPNSSDTISRRAAIDAVERNACNTQRAIDAINGLPSAQPEIIRCKDCKYHDEGYRRISVKWLPCMDICPGSNWYCGSAERREE